LSLFRLLFSESGVPGLRVILGFSAAGRRLLWAAVLALLAGLGLRDLYGAFRDFAQYADTVDVEFSRSPEGLALPAVTVCNLNQAGRRRSETLSRIVSSGHCAIRPAKNLHQSVLQLQRLSRPFQVRRTVFCGDIVLNRSTATEWQQKLCSDRGPRPIWLPEDEAADRKEFFKWVTEMQRRNAATAQVLGHQREDMVLACLLDDDDCNTPESLAGLRLLLNVEPEEYLPLSVEAGFVVNVHQAGVQVDFRKDGVFVPPRHTSFISVQQTIQKRLEPPYMNPCQPSWPDEYLQHTAGKDVYTSGACRDICAQLKVVSACRCQSHDYVILDRSMADICDEDDDQANACIQSVASRIGGSDCPCLDSCSTVTYVRTSSSLRWTRHALQQQRASKGIQGYVCTPSVLAEVMVHLASTQRSVRRHDPKVTVPRLVSSVGSILGMYVGTSFLLVFSVLDMASRALV
ncbi:unnamed protein product, partial [Ixodes hexagonus]